MSTNRGCIGIVTIGLRGDIQPFLALAGGLSHAGYSVVFITHGIFQRVVEEAGFAFEGLAGNPAKLLKTADWQEALYGDNHTAQMRLFYGALAEHVEDNVRLLYQTARQRPLDALLCNANVVMECMSVGQKLSIPTLVAATAPSLPSQQVPPVGLADKQLPLVTGLAHRLAAALVWHAQGDAVNHARRTLLGLPELTDYCIDGLPQAGLFSPLLQPRPDDWPAHAAVTGFCVLPMGEFAPPPELDYFLDAGEPPVYMGFGSMPIADLAELVHVFATLLRKYKLRGVFCAGWGELPADFNPVQRDLLVIHGAPHEWLFPRCAMAIHHGGAGTTAASLRAGIPTVVFPVQSEQAYWAHRVAAVGCGPAHYYHIAELSPVTLEQQLITCMDHSLKQHCQEFARRLHAEHGVDNFVEWFAPHFARLRNSAAAPPLHWTSDEDVLVCGDCCSRFTLVNRRSHCRSCGHIFCKACLTYCVLPSWAEPQFACRRCKAARNLHSTTTRHPFTFFQSTHHSSDQPSSSSLDQSTAGQSPDQSTAGQSSSSLDQSTSDQSTSVQLSTSI